MRSAIEGKTMTISRLLSAAAGLAALLLATQASAAASKDIRDWHVGCTGGLTCAMSFSDWDVKGINELNFVRTDDPDAAVELQVSAPPGFYDKGDAKGVYSFVIDGKVALTLPIAALNYKGNHQGSSDDGFVRDLSYSNDAAARALLAAMKAGTSMQLNYGGDLGTFTLPVKLTGVAGSMLYMDDVQDRLKRTDALEDKGDRAAPKMTQARDFTHIKDFPAAIRRDFADGRECNGLDDDLGDFPGFEMVMGNVDLYVVPCGQDGAYNQPFAAYFEQGGHFRRLSFPGTKGDGDKMSMSTSGTAYNVEVDPKTRVFTALFKGRGHGDCGMWSKWKMTDGKKPVLKLLEERRKDDCDGGDDPRTFPLTWSASK
jgi:hypothetical protein